MGASKAEPNHAQAIASLVNAIKANPLDISAYCGLARTFEAAGDFGKAELAIRRALEIQPRRHDVWHQLGLLYASQGTWRSAVDAFSQAVTLSPADAGSLIACATALIFTQDLRRASEVCGSLLERFPGRAESHILSGHISKIRGRVADAIESYRRALAIDSERTDALLNLVDLLPVAEAEALQGRLEVLRQDRQLPPRGAADVRFALARIHESANRIDQAFALYQEANAAAAAAVAASANAYDPGRAEAEVDEIIRLFQPAVTAEPLVSLDVGVRPIFIVGLPRSGTTLVERILGGHSRVSAGGEVPFMGECLRTFRLERRVSGARAEPRLSDQGDRRLLLQLRNSYLDALFERDLDRDCVTDKLPANFMALGLIRVLFPDAIIIHCVRDPMATCWSLYTSHFDGHLSYYSSLEHLAHYHSRVYLPLMQHWQKACRLDIVEIHYEALVASPEQQSRLLLAKCGLPWEEACLRIPDSETAIYTASLAQARRPIYTSSVARWRKFERQLAPLARGLRYFVPQP